MSAYDFEVARKLVADDTPFDALIMAALWRADTFNAARLHVAFPEICAETQARYDGTYTEHSPVDPYGGDGDPPDEWPE
jgi:hypothetical protein